MTEEQVVGFKNELRCYRLWSRKISELDLNVKTIEYELTGVKGVNFETAAHSTNPQDKIDRFFYLVEKKDKLLLEKSEYQKRISKIDRSLNLLEYETKEVIREIYIKGKSYIFISKKYNLSVGALQKRVNNGLKSIDY